MNTRVYFAQPTNGGPIKVGYTKDAADRASTLGSWIPGGVEIITTIPGGQARERMLKTLFAPIMIMGEWMPSCTAVWRVIVEAEARGDLPWLPAELATQGEMDQRWQHLLARYGSIREMGESLGIPKTTWLNFSPRYPRPVDFGNISAGEMLTHRTAPEFLLALHGRVETSARAAA